MKRWRIALGRSNRFVCNVETALRNSSSLRSALCFMVANNFEVTLADFSEVYRTAMIPYGCYAIKVVLLNTALYLLADESQ